MLLLALTFRAAGAQIRVNQLGYLPHDSKVAVLVSREPVQVSSFSVIDETTGRTVFSVRNCGVRKKAKGKITDYGELGRIKSTARLDFSKLKEPGKFHIEASCLFAGKTAKMGKPLKLVSPSFRIGKDVYDGTADFVLNYLRQQRCGWNPFLRDSCHTRDGIIVGYVSPGGSETGENTSPTRDSTYLDCRGGWHDASDCLQYTTTSATAIYQMMFAYMQCPGAFGDSHNSDGTAGANGIPDIVDEIYWGLRWLNRMNPRPYEMYNQIADDRDHVGMRLPSKDMADYGWGKGGPRPVWYCSGEPQMRGRHGLLNNTTGIASTAGKFASCFALGSRVLRPFYPAFAATIRDKAAVAYHAGVRKPGACQTASVLSPYIYEETDWQDDMELAAFELYRMTTRDDFYSDAARYAHAVPVKPWMLADTARHYQWYPFINLGHYLLAREKGGKLRSELLSDMRAGIDRVYRKGKNHPFHFGIPGIWCSNNLVSAMLTQCILYRRLSGDNTYREMECSLRDWLLGCNPWGVSMIVGLPADGVYPTQPHSYIIRYHLGNTTGGLVDGPVYKSIFGSLIGISTEGGVNYEEYQPGDVVYHDSTHDYSTNEPTLDGTASLTIPFALLQQAGQEERK